MELYVSVVAVVHMVEWRYVSMNHGVLYAVISGTMKMPLLPAVNWAIHPMVYSDQDAARYK